MGKRPVHDLANDLPTQSTSTTDTSSPACLGGSRVGRTLGSLVDPAEAETSPRRRGRSADGRDAALNEPRDLGVLLSHRASPGVVGQVHPHQNVAGHLQTCLLAVLISVTFAGTYLEDVVTDIKVLQSGFKLALTLFSYPRE